MLKRGLKPATVRLCHVTIRAALNDALRWGLAARKVAQAVRPPRPERREMKTWAPEEARRFLEAVAGSRFEAAYRLALCCGLRLGELAGLKWEDIDLEAGRLRVCRTLLTGWCGGGAFYGEPKTARGRRRVELPAQVVEALKRRGTAQKAERLLAGPRWQESGHVFTTLQGKPLDPSTP